MGDRAKGIVAAALVGALLVVGGARPTEAAPRRLSYVALGDSYTSGPLVLPHDTTWVPQDCGQSVFNYPHLAAPAIGATSFVDVSCGSATLDDLYEAQDGLPIGGTNAPQLDAVRADTDVVTLGMGGNDVGFVGFAEGCFRTLGPPFETGCTGEATAGGHDRVGEKIEATGAELGAALEAIHAKAPHAEVFVVSYPTALPDSGVGCWPYVPILGEDMPYIVAKFKQMNAMLRDQAARHDATYVDVYTSSIGHDACQVPALAWVNGVVVVPPSFPAHPNQLGLANSGRVVAAAIRQRLAERPATPTAVPSTVATPSAPPTTAAPLAGGEGGRRSLPVTGTADRTTLALLLGAAAAASGALGRRRVAESRAGRLPT